MYAYVFQAEVEMSQQYMLQATEVLTQAVNLSLAKGYTVSSYVKDKSIYSD